ncbi:MAG TPA: hypothetical protein VGN00_29290 [Puia sp.]|jgi:hypothetical protein
MASSWEYDYSILTQSDRDDPVNALHKICNRTSLFNQRNDLFEFYRAALQSDAWEDDLPEGKSDRLFFYETTLYLWEVAYRIREMIKAQNLALSYSPQTDSL